MVLHFRNEFMFFYFIIHDEISDKANEHHPHYTSHKAFGILNIIIHRYEFSVYFTYALRSRFTIDPDRFFSGYA